MSRPDSNAHTYLTPSRSALRRIRVPLGARVAQFEIGGKSPKVITAAAQVMSGKKIDRKMKRPGTQEWQRASWDLRDEIGEFRFIGDRQARACSQVRLFIAEKSSPDSDPTPVGEGRPAELSVALFGNTAAVEQNLKRAAQHLIYNGESILDVRDADGNGTLEWSAHSVSELTGSPGKWKLTDGLTPRDVDEDTEVIVRAWTPHPEKTVMADAPARAVLPAARELRALTMYVSSQVDSRLAGSGLLLLPQGIESMHSQSDDPDAAEYTFADELTDYMLEPVGNRDSAAAVVPFMATVPPDLIDKIQHITFDSALDAQAPQLREEAIRRIGLGMDSDPSVLLGQASSNHWSAWAVDENEVLYGVSPLVSAICHALTVGVVQPLLEADGVLDPARYLVWFDTTPLQVRPDRSKDAQTLYDKGVISREVLRRENGFGDADAPTQDETDEQRLWDLLQMRPDWADKILPVLGLVIPGIGGAPEAADEAAAEVEGPPGTEPVAVETVAPEADNGPPVMGDTEATA